MTDAGPSRLMRLSAYAVCVDGAGRLLLCRIAPGYTADGSTDTCRWFTQAELPSDRLVDIGELAVRLVL